MKKRTTRWQTWACLLFFCGTTFCAEAQENALQRLFDMAEAQNTSLRAGHTAVKMAEENLKAARHDRLPEINAQVSFSYLGDGSILDRNFSDAHRAAMPHYGNNFALEASQVLYAGGALNAGIELAKIAGESARLGVEQERQRVRLLIVGHYLNICQLNNEVRVYQEHIALAEKLIGQVKARQAAGTALKNDLTRHELQLQSLRLGLRRVEDNRSVAVFALKQTVGLPTSLEENGDEGTDYAFAYETFRADSAAVSSAALVMTDNSPALRRAALGVDAARQQLRLERSERLPKVALMAASRTDGPITIEVPPIDKNFHYWYVGVGEKYNLSSLYKNTSKLRRARLAVEEAGQQRAALEENIDQAMKAAYTDYRRSFVEWETFRKSATLAAENYAVVNNRYLNGLALVTDMTDAAATRLDADLQAANAEVRIAYAFYKIKYTAGTL